MSRSNRIYQYFHTISSSHSVSNGIDLAYGQIHSEEATAGMGAEEVDAFLVSYGYYLRKGWHEENYMGYVWGLMGIGITVIVYGLVGATS